MGTTGDQAGREPTKGGILNYIVALHHAQLELADSTSY